MISFVYRLFNVVNHCGSGLFSKFIAVSGYAVWSLIAVTGVGLTGIVSIESDCKQAHLVTDA